jgi:hypothetical protein
MESSGGEIVLCQQQYVGGGGGGLEQANTISYTLISIIPKFPKGKRYPNIFPE